MNNWEFVHNDELNEFLKKNDLDILIGPISQTDLFSCVLISNEPEFKYSRGMWYENGRMLQSNGFSPKEAFDNLYKQLSGRKVSIHKPSDNSIKEIQFP